MEGQPFEIPKVMPMQIMRPPETGIPDSFEMRREIKELVRVFVDREKLVPPMPLPQLREHAEAFLKSQDLPMVFINWVAVLINNQSWEEELAKVPYNRRLLLMPKCLRKESVCPAPFDELGLLCKRCGQCSLQDLQEEAEKMGYAVLIAEGSAIVMGIIETGQIDAIVGVSCLSVLEKSFPYMEAAAVPGIAIPLLQGDCIDTNVDTDWVWDVIHLTSEDKTRRMDLDGLRTEVKTWFTEDALAEIMGPAQGETERKGRAWLAANGKRWRPFLAACAYKALQAHQEDPLPEAFKKLAVGIECFHKASLIHDDIEDDDAYRYGEKTVHEAHGIPIALNLGDLLVGEGYRLIAESGAPSECLPEMLRIAAIGQKDLCLGQGAELEWMANPKPLRVQDVLQIFSLKTAPAFEVALKLGASYAGRQSEAVMETLTQYSRSLGVAYQIQDDLGDAEFGFDPSDVEAMRPSVLLAYAYQKAKGKDKKALKALWERAPEESVRPLVARCFEAYEVKDYISQLRESYKEAAVASLRSLDSANLKGLLRRVLGKIFERGEIKDWCLEYETRNAATGKTRTAIVV